MIRCEQFRIFYRTIAIVKECVVFNHNSLILLQTAFNAGSKIGRGEGFCKWVGGGEGVISIQ
jgi:hypothetical protein